MRSLNKASLVYFGAFFLLMACSASDSPAKRFTQSAGTPFSNSSSGGNTGTGTNSGSDGGYIPPPIGSSGGDSGLISHFRPALVIRASGCILCHGRVESTILTDFGFGSSYYFGAGAGLNAFSGSVYGNHGGNWSTLSLQGSVVVPRAPGPTAAHASLAAYVRSTLQSPVNAVLEKNISFIGAPTQARILEVAGVFPAQHSQWKYLPQSGTADISGLRLASSGQYVENTPGEEVVCAGDVVVSSVLFLNNLQLRTERGCRFYVTGSVFIQGGITYLGTNNDRNLQISSSRAVVMGLGPGATDGGAGNTLTNRLQNFWTRPGYFTRDSSRSTQEKLDSIVLDSSSIAELSDASAQVPRGRSVAFERLFINAPNYQSRYQGEFKGVIVAELALGSLGRFAFRFDEVFQRVPILPRLRESDWLRVSEYP
jgi:hypothetical protein